MHWEWALWILVVLVVYLIADMGLRLGGIARELCDIADRLKAIQGAIAEEQMRKLRENMD